MRTCTLRFPEAFANVTLYHPALNTYGAEAAPLPAVAKLDTLQPVEFPAPDHEYICVSVDASIILTRPFPAAALVMAASIVVNVVVEGI